MGLFGSKKKDEKTAALAEFFSGDELQKIRDTVAPKVESGAYGKYSNIAEALLDAVNEPQKTYTAKELGKVGGVLYCAGAMTKMEPALADTLVGAIAKMKAFKKM